MKCCNCNEEMILDDTDFNFQGNYDEYHYCQKCNISGHRKVRYGKTILKEWYSEDCQENNGIIKTEKYNSLDGSEFE